MATVDNLQIEINAQAVKANEAIDRLVTKLDILTTSLDKVNGSSLTGLANGVRRLGTSMQTMNNVKTADFTRLAKNIQKLSIIDTAGLNKAASSVTQIAKAFNNLENLSTSSKQLTEIATGIKQLGYSSATKAIDNIPKLAIAMKGLMQTLSTAPQVSQNLINMTNALAKLARTGSSSGKAATSLANSLNTYTTSSNKASKSSFSLASAIGKVYATYWVFFRTFGKIKDAIDISSDLTEVQNVVDVTFGDMAYKVEDLAQTSIEQFGLSELSLKQYASRFQAMGSAMGIDSSLIESSNKFLNEQTNGYVGLSDSMSDMSLNLTKLTADMASFYNVEQSAVAEDLESIFTGQTRPLRDYGLDLTQATLAEWALKNGLDADVQSMSQAEKTMLRYQYVLANTEAAQGDFARTADTWANQIRILKQNFEQLASVIGSTLINALKPLVRSLNYALKNVIEFVKNVSNALGHIFGWKIEISPGGITNDMEDFSDSAENAADGIGDAASNAKELKKNLSVLPFDELNQLSAENTNSGTTSSGSGSDYGISSGSGLQSSLVRVDSIFDTYKSEINNLLQLGEYIGESITKALNRINWNSVYQGAKNFGKGLADFLNGLISPELFGAVGRTIAGSLNTAIYAALSFGGNFDFYNFGLSIANGINEFFRTFDFAAFAKTVNKWVRGIWETIKTIIQNIDWKEVWEGVKEFLSNIDLETIEIIISALLIRKIKNYILGKTVEGGLISFLGSTLLRGGLSLGDLSFGFSSFSLKVGQALSFAQYLAGTLGGTAVGDVVGLEIFEGISWGLDKLLPDWAYDTLSNIGAGLVLGAAGGYWGGPLGTACGAVAGAIIGGLSTNIDGKPVYEALVDKVGEAVESFGNTVFNWDRTISLQNKALECFKRAFSGESFFEAGEDLIKGVGFGIASGFSFLTEPLEDGIDGIVKMFDPNYNSAIRSTGGDAAERFGQTMVHRFSYGVESRTEEVSNASNAIGETAAIQMAAGSESKIGVIRNASANMSDQIKQELDAGLSSGKTNKYGSNAALGVADGIKSYVNSKELSGAVKSIGTRIQSAMPDMYALGKNAMDGFRSGILAVHIPTPHIQVAYDTRTISGKSVQMPRFSVAYYATGGFPEEGPFFMNRGEIAGKFSNGKSVVANNEQITKGIADAVYPAVYNAIMSAMSNGSSNNEVVFRVEGDPNAIFKVVQEKAISYNRRTKKPAFEI